jgi:glycosyltransferase involved in cell wall biosynthesis
MVNSSNITMSASGIVWIYFNNHHMHPFICLVKDSLGKRGYSVSIVDLNEEPSLSGCQSDSGGDHAIDSPRERFMLKCCMMLIFRLWVLFERGVLRGLPGARWVRKLLLFFWMAAKTILAKPRVIMVTAVPATVIGWMANTFLNVRMVYYTFELHGDQVSALPWYWKAFEHFFVQRKIDALITQNGERASIYQNERGARAPVTIVHNYKQKRNITREGKLRRHLNLSEDIRIVLYEGVFIPGRWLKELALAAEFLPNDTRLVFLGEASEWWDHNVKPLLNRRELAEKVMIAPWVHHGDLLTFVADADVGVIIYDDSTRNNYYCEPGKLSDYVIAGVPVIAPPFPTISPVVKRYDIGVVFENSAPECIARAIKQVLAIPKAHWNTGIEKARQDLIWETQYPALERAVLGNGSL